MSINESIVEDAALSHRERESYSEVVLVGRLREAIRRLNFSTPEEAREDALRKVLRVGTPSLIQTNRAFPRLILSCCQDEVLSDSSRRLDRN